MKVEALLVVVDGEPFTIPAYTRSAEEFAQVLTKHVNAYGAGTQDAGTGFSIGDFALYLLAQAAMEPHTIAD